MEVYQYAISLISACLVELMSPHPNKGVSKVVDNAGPNRRVQ